MTSIDVSYTTFIYLILENTHHTHSDKGVGDMDSGSY